MNGLTAIIDQRADTAPFITGNENIATLESSALHQDGRHGTAAALELRLNDSTLGQPIGIALQLEDFRLQENGLFQLIKINFLGRRHFHIKDIAAEFLDDDLVAQQFITNAIRVGIRSIDFVDRNNDRHFRRFRMVERFDGLRLNAIIRRDNQNNDVGDLRAACTHCRKGGVAGRIDKRNPLTVGKVNLISANMLRDAAGLTCSNIRCAQGI